MQKTSEFAGSTDPTLSQYTLFCGDSRAAGLCRNEIRGYIDFENQKEPPALPSRYTSLSLWVWNQAVELLYVHIAFNTVKAGIRVSPVGLSLPPSDCFCS